MEIEIRPSYNQGLPMAAALQVTTIQAMLLQCRGDKECFKYGGIGHFRKDCPKLEAWTGSRITPLESHLTEGRVILARPQEIGPD